MPKVSVKIMRSYDYCHFEVCLSSDDDLSLKQINEMRKDCARLVDEAVKQYKEATKKLSEDWTLKKALILKEAKEIRKKPISEWTPQDEAIIKYISDINFDTQWDYDDEEEQF